MKIRAGFVSNSSSTSYVIAVTRNFKPDPEKVQAYLKACLDWGDYEGVTDTASANERIEAIIRVLCSNEQLWNSDEPVETVYEFLTAFKEDVVLFTIDGGPEDGKTLNILADSCKDKTMKRLTDLDGDQNED